MTMRHEGGCHCGAVRYAFSEAPEFTFYCHCQDCQKTTGSPLALSRCAYCCSRQASCGPSFSAA